MVIQKEIKLLAKSRGAHLITGEILSALNDLPNLGMANIFVKHTSCALTINENCDPSVRADLNHFLDVLIPENWDGYTHTAEGPDDMPAHIKASLVGTSLNIPITNGKLNLGTWQGIYLCESRNSAGPRKLVLTVYS